MVGTLIVLNAQSLEAGITSGSQKTGFAKRGLHVRTAGEFTPSAALGGRDRGFPKGVVPKCQEPLIAFWKD